MSIALSEFWTRLVRSGITDAAGCKLLAAAFSEANAGTPPSDAAALAQFMIRAGRLTPFQSKSLLADQPREIRAGSFLIESDASAPPLGRWVRAVRVDDGRSGFLLRASADELAGGRLQWLEAHGEVAGKTLQSFELESHGTSMLVFSPLPAGRTLNDRIRDGVSLPAREACEIGIALADALEPMHTRQLVHGALRPDRVWMTDDGQAILLRDPSGPPLRPVDDSTATWFDEIDLPAAYAAPEFASDAQVCSQATDIYSLGCLIFRLVAGRTPYVGSSASETIAAHASQTPDELADAVARGESGDPLYRVIAFAMAKNPAARFATVPQLASALRATLTLLPKPDKMAVETPAKKPAADQGNTKRPIREKQTPESKPESKPASIPPRQSKEVTRTAGQAVSKPQPPIQPGSQPESTPQAKGGKQPTPPRKPQPPPPEPRRAPPEQRVPVATVWATAPPVESPRAAAPPPASPPEPPPASPPEPPASPPEPPASPPEPPASPPEPPALPPEAEPINAEPPETASIDAAPPAADEVTEPASPGRPPRRRKKKRNRAPLVLGAMCVAVLMLLIGLVVHDPNATVAEKRKRPPIPDVIPRVTNSTPTPTTNGNTQDGPASEAVAGYELVSDDRLLFVPPYANDTPNAPLDLLPPGPRVIVSVRLAEITQNALGSDLINALSPELAGLIETAVARAKVPAASIQRCTAAMHPGKEGWPEVSLAIELNQPQPAVGLIEKWEVAPSRTADGAKIFAGDSVGGDAYYFSAAENEPISRFAVGSVERISEVAAAEGGAIPLTRTFQTLWDSSSEQADLVVLITPNFLFADGRALLKSSAPELVRPLKRVLQPDVAAALVTADFGGDQVYFETRLAPSGGISEAALMRAIRESIASWPTWADDFIVDSAPDPSWKLLASRLPSMMRFVVGQTRFGISEGSVVANTYLPGQAVPQVTLATLLAMNTQAGGAATMASAASTPALTVDEMLDRKMTVSFDQLSLEFAVDAIVSGFKETLPEGSTMPPVRIIGGDLQLEGITQNQQVRDFAKTDLALRTVLTDLVVGANPNKSATGPKDPLQKLIWVVTDDPENPGKKVIFVTTRAAAENKYDLPSEFQP